MDVDVTLMILLFAAGIVFVLWVLMILIFIAVHVINYLIHHVPDPSKNKKKGDIK